MDEQAQGRYSLIVEQMKKDESVTEELGKKPKGMGSKYDVHS